MKETIRTFSTRDKANTFSIKKILKLIQLEKRQWGEGLGSSGRGMKGLLMSMMKRDLSKLKYLCEEDRGGAVGASPAGLE